MALETDDADKNALTLLINCSRLVSSAFQFEDTSACLLEALAQRFVIAGEHVLQLAQMLVIVDGQAAVNLRTAITLRAYLF